jgi:23S rRNA (uracil1939-C5)-methyltransferase
MVVLVTNGRALPRAEKLVEGIRSELPQTVSIVQNVNSERTNVILGKESRVLWGTDVIYDRIGEVEFAISARSFYQVNPVQTTLLYEKTLEYAGLSGRETVIDAYCGIGTITLFLAKQAKQVYGVEVVAEAIADARRNAELNGIENVEFEVGEAERVMPQWRERGEKADVIVVDPPRKGCDDILLQTMADIGPERIVYVSCNPATLARDVRVLAGRGYRLVEVQPVDMFPQTTHVECVALLERVEIGFH